MTCNTRPAAGLRRLIMATLVVAVSISPVSADQQAATVEQLQALQRRIEQLQQGLQSARERKDRLQQTLRSTERDIGQATRQLRELKQRITTHQQQLAELNRDQARQTGALATLREQLARDARAAYAMGRQEQVKLILNQEDPGTVGRMLTYYGYFAQARTERIATVNEHLVALATTQTAIARQRDALTVLRDQQAAKTTKLQARQDERRTLLAQVAQDIKAKGDELQRLARDEKRLQELVRQLQDLLADIPRSAGDDRPFNVRKGQLDWPVAGRLAARFGTRRAVGDLKWKGVVIEAPAGSEVVAVSGGRVAFADWLRGFGLLIIVDHGDGYMTLYGQNQSLYKEAGEWVETGDVLATVGDNGALPAPGLYFELRHNGRPVNPVQWCRGNAPPTRTAGR